MTLIDGKEVSGVIKDQIRDEVASLVAFGKRAPELAVIIVGDDPASQTYVKNKGKACEYTGIKNTTIKLQSSITEAELLFQIRMLNEAPQIDGILVQLPLPKHIDEQKVLRAISPDKDVDGFHPENIARLFLGEDGLFPCTPQGIFRLLEHYHYDVCGKHIVIVGRSNIVGKPCALLALRHNATVTVCHSKTENLRDICKTADILICAIGKAKFIDSSYVKDGAIVIDVGINRNEEGKLCGDVDFDDVKDKVEAITPVPGGVGPMTIALLMENTMASYNASNRSVL